MQIAALMFIALASVLFATDTRAQPASPEDGAPAAYERAAPPTPRPAPITPEKGAWPFSPWSYAKAYTFNFFEDSNTQLQVVTQDKIWSPYIRSEQLVSEAQALSAAKLVQSINGTFENSKCIFPRHAIVFFDARDEPIASVDVCFECDGILVWPDYETKDAEAYADPAFMKAYKNALAQFETLFGHELALPLSYTADPQPPPSLLR